MQYIVVKNYNYLIKKLDIRYIEKINFFTEARSCKECLYLC